MKIALIQQHATRNFEDNLSRGINAFHTAAEYGARLVAYAELGLNFFWPQHPATPETLQQAEPIPGPTTEKFAKLSRQYGIVTVLNLFERDGDKTYDASPVIDADGTLLGVTRMAHVMDGQGFFEKGYYSPGDNRKFIYDSQVGRIGVAICYDRHFPEYMRNLGLLGAELVVIPQAGAVGEWPPGIFESECQIAAFQNGYYVALVNRVGIEETLDFCGKSYVTDPEGRIVVQAPAGEDAILYADIDLKQAVNSTAKRFFLSDRRPDLYKVFSLDK